LELRQGWTCNCTVMMSVDKIKMYTISVPLTHIKHTTNLYLAGQ
jgi:hypothetical protein